MSFPHVLPKLSVLALCIAACPLTGCSSDGGVQGEAPMMPTPPPPPAAPPPPPPRAMSLPAAPAPTATPIAPVINGLDMALIRWLAPDQSETFDGFRGAGSLTKQGDGVLYLRGDVRFDAGVMVEDGTVSLLDQTLFADVRISEGAVFEMRGDIVGDVVNAGVFDSTDPMALYGAFYDADIFGDYTQGPNGVLQMGLASQGEKAATPLLEITGVATLDGIVEFTYGNFVPAAGYLEWLLHARGGVEGRFVGWRTNDRRGPIFLTGDLHYGPNDVWFVATRVSTQSALAAANVSDARVLSSAARVDAAFAAGDRLAAQPQAALSDVQRAFLQSAATIQRLDDLDQAKATFDSLAGVGHVAATEALTRQAFGAASALSAHAGAIRPGDHVGAWSQRHGVQPGNADALEGHAGGADRWLSERLLFGSRVGSVSGVLGVDSAAGAVRSDATTAHAYLRRSGDDGSYAMGSAGFGQYRLRLARGLDFGQGLRPARSERDVSLAQAAFEAGRQLSFAGGELAAYAVVDYAALRSDGFVEQGNTGFELRAQPSLQQYAAAGLGLRYGRRWHGGGGGWLQLDFDARYQPSLWSAGTVSAFFTGTPDAVFDLAGRAASEGPHSIALLLSGAGGGRWIWQLQYGSYGGEPAAAASFEFALR